MNDDPDAPGPVTIAPAEEHPDPDDYVLRFVTSTGQEYTLAPDRLGDLIAQLAFADPKEAARNLVRGIRSVQPQVVDRRSDPERNHLHKVLVQEGQHYRVLLLRTTRLDPEDTMTGAGYLGEVASVGKKYTRLGRLPRDGSHEFSEGHLMWVDSETGVPYLYEETLE
jgi:hypothetical protein